MDTKEPEHTEEGNEQVRQALRDLPKVTAPWYFEAKLQQRLREEGQRTWVQALSRGPIPAYALSAVTVMALGVVGYYLLVKSPQGAESMATDSVTVGPAVSEPPAVRSQVPVGAQPGKPEVIAPGVVVTEGRRGGPSTPTGEQAEEAAIMDRREEGQFRIELDVQSDEAEGADKLFAPLRPESEEKPSGFRYLLHDTVSAGKAVRDSLDSLRARRDSTLQNRGHPEE